MFIDNWGKASLPHGQITGGIASIHEGVHDSKDRLAIVKAQNRASSPSVLVHGGGVDRLYALLDLGGFVIAAQTAQSLSLTGQCGDDDGVVRAVLFFQDDKKVFVKAFGIFGFAPKIVRAAKSSQIEQGLRAIVTVEYFVDLNGAQENRLRLGEVLLKSVHACQHPEAVGYARAVLAVGLYIQFDCAIEELLSRSDVVLWKP